MRGDTIALFLAVYFTIVAVFYSVRLNYNAKQKIFNGCRYSLEWFGQWTFKVFQFTIWGICVARVFYRELDTLLVPFDPLNTLALNILGLAVLMVGTVGVVWAHYALGLSWASGVNANAKLPLVVKGIYQYSRNPIFLSVMLCQLGFFLLLPSAFTLLCLLLGWFFIIKQVFVEERFLKHRFGDAYTRYQAKAPRWI